MYEKIPVALPWLEQQRSKPSRARPQPAKQCGGAAEGSAEVRTTSRQQACGRAKLTVGKCTEWDCRAPAQVTDSLSGFLGKLCPDFTFWQADLDCETSPLATGFLHANSIKAVVLGKRP